MDSRMTPRWVFALQIASVAMIWVFVIGISTWILHLLQLSRRLDDIPHASLAISMLAIPVFLLGASVLTYVFLGLRLGREGIGPSEDDERKA